MTERIRVQEDSIDQVLQVTSTLPEFDKPFSREYFEQELQDREALVVVGYVDEQPAGFMVGYDKDGDGAFYCWWAGVDPNYRQQGVLTHLMGYQESWAEEHGYNKITIKTLNARRAMLAYLVKAGFNFTDVEKREIVEENRIYLEKEI